MLRVRPTLAFLAAALFPAIPSAPAGNIDFKDVDLSISKVGGRPQPPIITATDATGEWRATDAPVEFRLRVRAKVNTGSHVTLIRIGVPGLQVPGGMWAPFSMPAMVSSREVVVDPTTHRIPSNGLAIPSIIAAGTCADAQRNGASGTFDRAFTLDAEVEVTAARGTSWNQERRHIFVRTIPTWIRCVSTSHVVAKPQRTPIEPQRTPVEPKRTALPYRPLSAELGFARAANATACPIDIRQSIRIVSPGPGMAKVYIVRQDQPGVLGAPIYVNVATRMPDAKYVGVLQKTIRFTTTFNRTYRVLAVNPFGEPVVSPWAVLDVKC